VIVVDTNVFVRYLVGAVVPADEPLVVEARTLFASAATGNEQFTTNEAVIAEVLYVLTSSRLYQFSRRDVGERFGTILESTGCRLPHKERVLDALDLWMERPRLSFVDALTVLQSMAGNDRLATFDEAMATFPGIRRWRADPV
jgi:predicted nucleic acid-binding protein